MGHDVEVVIPRHVLSSRTSISAGVDRWLKAQHVIYQQWPFAAGAMCPSPIVMERDFVSDVVYAATLDAVGARAGYLNVAYQHWLAAGIVVPDCYLWLRADPAVAHSRVRSKGHNPRFGLPPSIRTDAGIRQFWEVRERLYWSAMSTIARCGVPVLSRASESIANSPEQAWEDLMRACQPRSKLIRGDMLLTAVQQSLRREGR